jgi:hypothetical protein
MNHKFFVLFVGYTMASCLFALSLIGLRALYCGVPSLTSSPSSGTDSDENKGEYQQECTGWNTSYASLTLAVISVVFLIFTSCMFVEQIEAIKTNASKIARMKMRVGQAGTELSRVTEVRGKSVWTGRLETRGLESAILNRLNFNSSNFIPQEFNEMFGGDSNQVAWHWFFPLPVEFPPGMKKVVMGYEWDETFDAVPYQEPSNGDVELGTGRSAMGGRIELTAAQGRSNATGMSASNKEKSSEHDGADDVLVSGSGGEAKFAGNPIDPERPKLIKRNSRDQDATSREPQLMTQGTLT